MTTIEDQLREALKLQGEQTHVRHDLDRVLHDATKETIGIAGVERSWWRNVAAAVLIATVGIAGWFALSRTSTPDQVETANIACGAGTDRFCEDQVIGYCAFQAEVQGEAIEFRTCTRSLRAEEGTVFDLAQPDWDPPVIGADHRFALIDDFHDDRWFLVAPNGIETTVSREALSVSWFDDSRLILTFTDRAEVQSTDGAVIETINFPTDSNGDPIRINALDPSPDGRLIAGYPTPPGFGIVAEELAIFDRQDRSWRTIEVENYTFSSFGRSHREWLDSTTLLIVQQPGEVITEPQVPRIMAVDLATDEVSRFFSQSTGIFGFSDMSVSPTGQTVEIVFDSEPGSVVESQRLFLDSTGVPLAPESDGTYSGSWSADGSRVLLSNGSILPFDEDGTPTGEVLEIAVTDTAEFQVQLSFPDPGRR